FGVAFPLCRQATRRTQLWRHDLRYRPGARSRQLGVRRVTRAGRRGIGMAGDDDGARNAVEGRRYFPDYWPKLGCGPGSARGKLVRVIERERDVSGLFLERNRLALERLGERRA